MNGHLVITGTEATGTNQLGGIDFFAIGTTTGDALYYIDDVEFATINSFNNVYVNKSDANVTMQGGVVVNNNLDIEGGNGSNLILNPTARLTVIGDLHNNSGNDGLVFKSDATETASLIHNTPNVPAIVERYYSHSAGSGWYYHLTCSPVNGVAFNDFNVAPGETYAYKYIPPNSGSLEIDTLNRRNITIDSIFAP